MQVFFIEDVRIDIFLSLHLPKLKHKEKKIELDLCGWKGCVQNRDLWRPHLELSTQVFLFVTLSQAPTEIRFKFPLSCICKLAKSLWKLVTLLMLLWPWPDLTAAGKKILHPKCGISP